jgi:hypothetical protein
VAQKGITSGGGFSVRNSRPSWQDAAVKGYFKNAAAAGAVAVPGYDASGRGYPDISMAGIDYLVYVGGVVNALSGTSASCPALSGLISNINAGRMRAGKGSIGWINPALYQGGSTFLNDIVSGDIRCAADGTCCNEGFYALPGWDPTSGMGSPNFKKMYAYFLPLGTTTASFSSGGAKSTGTVWCTVSTTDLHRLSFYNQFYTVMPGTNSFPLLDFCRFALPIHRGYCACYVHYYFCNLVSSRDSSLPFHAMHTVCMVSVISYTLLRGDITRV